MSPRALTVVGLFAGVGGIELGLARAGHETGTLCEIDPRAQAVLRAHFANITIREDVLMMRRLPTTDVLAAGFPCQDLSQAGVTAGIRGKQSGIVDHLLDLLAKGPGPTWVLLENVPFMLHLHRGAAMAHLTTSLGRLGYTWAYRVVDTHAFGLPQRRKRVYVLASKTQDPRPVLLEQEAGEPRICLKEGIACGFYWTEGYRGLGWAVDAIPTLKGGSTVGIPSQPAIWMPNGSIALPDIRDGERLQGFPAGWTSPFESIGRKGAGHRWKLVGNAVSVPTAQWLGERLATCASRYNPEDDRPLARHERWPAAAWGYGDRAFRSHRSAWPVRWPQPPLADFLQHPTTPLSARATQGFLARAIASPLRMEPRFLEAVRKHLQAMQAMSAAA